MAKIAAPRAATPAPPRAGRRADIQGLRALAVVLVILDHADVPGFGGGFVGVDIFFVISGYVITGVLLAAADRAPLAGLAEFYAHRIRRIVPAAAATLVATVAVAAVALGRWSNPALGSDARWASLFSANFRFIRTGANYFVAGLHPSLVTQFWSLAVEEQFYLCFPLLVFTVARFTSEARRLPVLRGVLAGAVVTSACWSALTSAGQPVTAYYSPATRFWEIGLGCLLATCATGRPIRTARSERLAAGAGGLLLAAALTVSGPGSVYPGTLAWLPCLGAALLIWAGRLGVRNPLSLALSTRAAVYLGDISYSLYLTHYLWLKLPEQLGHPLTGWPWRLGELAGTLVTAALSYHLLENPIRRSARLRGDGVATALVFGVGTAAVWATAAVAG